MLSIDVAAKARLLGRRQEYEEFFRTLTDLHSASDAVFRTVAQSNARAEIHAEVRKTISESNPIAFFQAGSAYKSALDAVLHGSSFDDWNLYPVSQALGEVLLKFENFLRAPDEGAALILAWEARSLSQELNGVTRIADGVSHSLYQNSAYRSSPEVLTIRISGEADIRDVQLILRGLSRAYQAICELVGEPDQAPLELLKIETGSFFAALKGGAKAVAILSKFISGVARYALISNRIANTGESAEALNALLTLKSALEAQGISAEGMGPDIAASACALAKQAKVLTKRANDLEIDGTLVSLGDDVAALLGHEVRLIENKGSDSED